MFDQGAKNKLVLVGQSTELRDSLASSESDVPMVTVGPSTGAHLVCWQLGGVFPLEPMTVNPERCRAPLEV